jgi:signal transduction histidine kinase
MAAKKEKNSGTIRGKIVWGYLGIYGIIALMTAILMLAVFYIITYERIRDAAYNELQDLLAELPGDTSEDELYEQLQGSMPGYVVRYDLYLDEEKPVTYAEGDLSEPVPTKDLSSQEETYVASTHVLSSAGVDKSYQGAFDYSQANGGLSNIKELNKLYLKVKSTAYQYNEMYQRDMLDYYHLEAVIDMRSAMGSMDIGESLRGLVGIAAVLLAAFFIGLVIMIIYGAYKTRKYLKPVEDITNLVSQINESNLSSRIDVESARCELKELVMTINSMLDRVYAGYAKQKMFVSDVSHELRTPISVVAGYANMLKRWARDDEAVFDESVNAIIEEADNMKYLVDNLLFLVRSDNNTINYDMESFDFSELMRDVFKSSLLVDNNKHNITEDIADGIYITGDRARIKQAARIFIENAIKYTPPMGSIMLSLKKEGEGAVVTIADNGIGISKKDMAHIFKRFYRGDKSRNRQAGGYGLGLPIARSIINAHGGKIHLRSKENEGTIIDIIISV